MEPGSPELRAALQGWEDLSPYAGGHEAEEKAEEWVKFHMGSKGWKVKGCEASWSSYSSSGLQKRKRSWRALKLEELHVTEVLGWTSGSSTEDGYDHSTIVRVLASFFGPLPNQ